MRIKDTGKRMGKGENRKKEWEGKEKNERKERKGGK